MPKVTLPTISSFISNLQGLSQINQFKVFLKREFINYNMIRSPPNPVKQKTGTQAFQDNGEL